MSKKILFFVILFNLLNLNHFAHSEIIPPKKPIQTKEEKQNNNNKNQKYQETIKSK